MPPQTKRIAKTWDQVYQREEVLPLHIAELRARIFQVFWKTFDNNSRKILGCNKAIVVIVIIIFTNHHHRHRQHHDHCQLSANSLVPGWQGGQVHHRWSPWGGRLFCHQSSNILLLFVNQYMRGELFSFSKVRWSSGFPSESIGISWRGIMSWQNMRAYKS